MLLASRGVRLIYSHRWQQSNAPARALRLPAPCAVKTLEAKLTALHEVVVSGLGSFDSNVEWKVSSSEARLLTRLSPEAATSRLAELRRLLPPELVNGLVKRAPGTFLTAQPTAVRDKVFELMGLLRNFTEEGEEQDCGGLMGEAVNLLSRSPAKLTQPASVLRERLESVARLLSGKAPARQLIAADAKLLEQRPQMLKFKLKTLRAAAASCAEWQVEWELLTPSSLSFLLTRGTRILLRLAFLAERPEARGLAMRTVASYPAAKWAALHPDFQTWLDAAEAQQARERAPSE